MDMRNMRSTRRVVENGRFPGPGGSDDDRPGFGDIMGRGIGTLIALVFMGVATAAYFLAESHFSSRGELYREAAGEVADMPVPDTVLPEWEGRLAHVAGVPRVENGAEDPLFGVAADAVCIFRNVQYYQWQEEVTNNRREGQASARQYVYERQWTSRPVDSARFRIQGHDNTVLASLDALAIPARRIMLGAYELGDAVKTHFPDARPLPVQVPEERLAESAAAAIPEALWKRGWVRVRGNEIYIGRNPRKPGIGDVRVTLTAAWPQAVSIIARVADGRLEAFTAANGESLAEVRAGKANANRMLGGLALTNALGLWGARLGLAAAYALLLRLLAAVYEKSGRGIVYFGAGLACLVMCAVWFVLHPGSWAGLGFLPVSAAMFGFWTAKQRNAS